MRPIILMVFLYWGVISGISPENYFKLTKENFELTNKVEKVISLQTILEQQLAISYQLQKTSQTRIKDTLAVFNHIEDMVKYQAAFTIKAQREAVIKAHYKDIPRKWSKERQIARADSIIAGTYRPKAAFTQSKYIYVPQSQMQKFQRVPKLPQAVAYGGY